MSHTSFPSAELAHLIGTARAPVVIDVRSDDHFASDPRLIPGSIRRDSLAISDWGKAFRGRSVVVNCKDGLGLSQAVAARLRHEGVQANHLAGGFEAWLSTGNLVARADVMPRPNADGRTVWVTRERSRLPVRCRLRSPGRSPAV